jgi:penicillin-binding protein 2
MRYTLHKIDPSRTLRTALPLVLAAVVSLVLVVRLAYLQIYMNDEFHLMSEENRVRLVEMPAPRGIILDRYKRIIVDNRPSFDVTVSEDFIQDMGETLSTISELTGVPESTLSANLKKEREKYQKFHPLTVARDVPLDKAAPLITNLFRMSGVALIVRPVRNYVHGPLAPHLFGHMSEIDKKLLEKDEFSGYRMGDIIGRGGVEETWDRELRGVDGGVQVEVDSTGKESKVLGELKPQPGNNLVLTIDWQLQDFARRLMEERDYSGAIIAMNPQNFEVLAMVSEPGFDPALFARGITPEEWNGLITDKRHPLEDKCISGQYAPGSTYKLITASAALEEGVIDEETELYCPGSFLYGGASFSCWKAGGHGRISIHRAIVESCDVFFYKLGDQLGIDRLAVYGSGYGFGKPTGIPMVGEKPGICPSTKWKEAYFGIPWFPGETISCAIGQGYNLVTPLQLLSAFCALANNGTLYQPRVVKEILAPDGTPETVYKSEKTGSVPVSRKTLDIVKRGFYGAVNEPGGTGWQARVEGKDVCGKTGTAQVISGSFVSKYLPYELRDHAWFVCFAPLNNPEIAVVVLVEHGGFGGSTAAPLAGEIIKKYYALKGRSRR